MTAVFDVVAAAEAGTQYNANHCATGFEIPAHFVDLTGVPMRYLLPGVLRYVDLSKTDRNNFALVVVTGFECFTRDGLLFREPVIQSALLPPGPTP